MFHFKAPGRFLPKGTFHFIEVGDDQEASRQVNVFRNGHSCHYDRSHRRDAFGYLVGLKFSLKDKWRKFFPGAEIVTAAEFEAVWREAVEQNDASA